MRILIDTNILISALLFPRSGPARALLYVANHHEMVLCERNITELMSVLRRKAPQYLPNAIRLLAELPYEWIPEENDLKELIRDIKDQPILNSAIIHGVDIILTGDKDFLSIDLEHPKCMTVTQFFETEDIK